MNHNNIILCLKDSNFENNVINSDSVKRSELFLVDFWAEWCNPCKILAPIIDEIAVEFNGRLKVAKLNVDENPVTTKNYKIRSIPTLLLIRDGVVLSVKVGLLSKQQIQEFVNACL